MTRAGSYTGSCLRRSQAKSSSSILSESLLDEFDSAFDTELNSAALLAML